MFAKTFQIGLILSMLLLIATGCRTRRSLDFNHISTDAVKPEAVLSPSRTVVSASFERLHDSHANDRMSFFDADPLGVSLSQAYSLAACNSSLANLIERERQAIRCETGCVKCVDCFLAGQAAEQRNKSAADAGELLIRLAGAQLQSEILEIAQDKMAELQRTIDAAAANGLATAQAQSKLDSEQIELQQKQAKLRAGIFEITIKLSQLLGLDSSQPRRLLPNHQFVPELNLADADELIIAALQSRPELNSVAGFGGCSGDGNCLSLLSNLDNRLGLAIAKPVTRILRCRRQDAANSSDCCCHIRQQQLDELRRLREEMIRQQVLQHFNEAHLHHEKLSLEHQHLQELEQQAERIDSAAELDAQQAFLDSISNFAEQQLARSRRIDAMIEFEVAKIRLDASTGKLVTACRNSAGKADGCDGAK